MMRIGVNIPNDLLRRLEPLKPELNVSEACREALTRRAERYEVATANLDDPPTATGLEHASAEEIERWTMIEFDWEALGYEDAVTWVASATWEDWNAWRTAQEFLQRQDRPAWGIQPRLNGSLDKSAKTFDDRRSEYYQMCRNQSDEYLDWLYYNGIEMDWEAAEQDYGRARVAYLRTAWQMICKRRDDHLESQRQQRLEERRSRPQPSMPDHLFSDDPE